MCFNLFLGIWPTVEKEITSWHVNVFAAWKHFGERWLRKTVRWPTSFVIQEGTLGGIAKVC